MPNESFSERRIAIIVLCVCVCAPVALGLRVWSLRSELSSTRKLLQSENIASASQELENISLPQNKAFVVCNRGNIDVEIRNFSVAYWDSAGRLQVLNAFNHGWSPYLLRRGEVKQVQLAEWPGTYALYAIDLSQNGGARLYTGTSETEDESCIRLK
ncbi:MAG: hypothetical protein ABSG84_09980 [Acidobacteriaceae bacterium]